jgi:hypothetical protein
MAFIIASMLILISNTYAFDNGSHLINVCKETSDKKICAEAIAINSSQKIEKKIFSKTDLIKS